MQDRDDREFQRFMDGLQTGALTYDEVKKRYLELGDRIRQRYEREYTAMSLDIVQSRTSKLDGSELDAQLTFDAYHNWIDGVLDAFGCHHPNFTWAGDGLIAIFEQPDAAVACARNIIEELPHFNSRHNRLQRPVQVRLGIHTGAILPGDSPGLGKIASRTFDLAGHLQKTARPNQIRLSETTYALLKEGAGQFVPDSAELPNPSAVFVYPPHTAGGPGAARPTPGEPAPAPPAPVSRSSVLPWIIAGAAALAALIVTLVLLWPRKLAPQPGAAESPLQQVIVPQPGQRPDSAPNQAARAPADPEPVVPAPGAAAAPPAAEGRPPSPWEPSRVPWRSPDADSGVPPRFIAAAPERKWLLAIGVGRYADGGVSAEGAGADAQFAAGVLARAAGIPPDHVRVLTDSQATLDGIKAGFQWLQQSASSGQDTVLVYLAGAAGTAPDRPDFRHPSGSGYALLPHDTNPRDLPNTAVYGYDLAAWLGATRAQTIVVFADTAQAALLDLPSANDAGRQIALLAAAGPVQKTGRGRQASHFAESLAAAAAGQADRSGDRRVSLEELRQFVTADTARRSGNQQLPVTRVGFGGFVPEIYFVGR